MATNLNETNPNALPRTMHVLELSAYEGLEALKLREKPVPTPGPGQVLVKVAAAAVNPSDLNFIHGRYGFRRALPTVPGFEASGQVVAGDGAYPESLVGQRVACVVQAEGDGTWAEYVLADAATCLPLLPDVTFEQGAMLFVNPFTAWALVERAQEEGHRAVVQTAAASALGKMVLRLADRAGLPVIHVVRRAEQVEALRALGAAHVLSSHDADFGARLEKLCGELGATLAFDAVGGDLPGRLLEAMPEGGRVIVYGDLGGPEVRVPVGELLYRGGRVDGFWLAHWLAGQDAASLSRRAEEVQRALATDLQAEVRAEVGLTDAVAAIRDYAARMSDGKLLLAPSGT